METLVSLCNNCAEASYTYYLLVSHFQITSKLSRTSKVFDTRYIFLAIINHEYARRSRCINNGEIQLECVTV